MAQWKRRTEKVAAALNRKNKFSVGETIEIMKPDGRNLEVVVKSICDEDGNEQESAPHPKQILWVDLGADVDKYDILRKKRIINNC